MKKKWLEILYRHFGKGDEHYFKKLRTKPVLGVLLLLIIKNAQWRSS
jgi:hypothetical protein